MNGEPLLMAPFRQDGWDTVVFLRTITQYSTEQYWTEELKISDGLSEYPFAASPKFLPRHPLGVPDPQLSTRFLLRVRRN